jgi:hypothetical protein
MLSNEPITFQLCLLVVVLCWVRVIAIVARTSFEPKWGPSELLSSDLELVEGYGVGYYHYSFPGPEPRTFEAGITGIVSPYAPRWTGETVEATHESDALYQFYEKGYHRNLVVREVFSDRKPA